jgi:hypothetical protein
MATKKKCKVVAIWETPQLSFETYDSNAKQQKLGNFGNYIGYYYSFSPLFW